MKGKHCLVTGANSGIGFATAEELASRGAAVVMVCRDKERGEAARARIAKRVPEASIDLLIADLSSQAEIRRLAAQLIDRYARLDVLVNNAGVFLGSRRETADGLEATFAINHLAYFQLTNLLLPLLKASAPSRIVNVSSNAHDGARLDLSDLNSASRYNGMRAYRNSKLANLLFTYELARRLEGSGVTANALHPGVVGTRIGRASPLAARLFFILAKPVLLSPRKGAATTLYLATSPEVEGISGKYFMKRAPRETTPVSHDRELAEELWRISERLTGLNDE